MTQLKKPADKSYAAKHVLDEYTYYVEVQAGNQLEQILETAEQANRTGPIQF